MVRSDFDKCLCYRPASPVFLRPRLFSQTPAAQSSQMILFVVAGGVVAHLPSVPLLIAGQLGTFGAASRLFTPRSRVADIAPTNWPPDGAPARRKRCSRRVSSFMVGPVRRWRLVSVPVAQVITRLRSRIRRGHPVSNISQIKHGCLEKIWSNAESREAVAEFGISTFIWRSGHCSRGALCRPIIWCRRSITARRRW